MIVLKFHRIHPTTSAQIEPHVRLFNEKMYRETPLYDAYEADHPAHFDSQAAFILTKELHSSGELARFAPAEAIAGIGILRYNSTNRPDIVPNLAAVRFRKADSTKGIPTSNDMVNRFIDISAPELARLDDVQLCIRAVAIAAYRHVTGAQQPLDLVLDTLQDDAFVRDFLFNQR